VTNISYIYFDTQDPLNGWKGYSEDFDPNVTTVAEKISEAVNLRAAGRKREDFIKFIIITS